MKRKTILLICLSAVLTIAANSKIYSQTSDSKIVSKAETVSFLLQQNENDRALISKQENRIADLESELIVERENSASISKSYETAQSEITSLKTSNAALARAVAVNEEVVAKLQTDNAKQRERATRATGDKWKVIIIAAGIIALKFILP